ncbi:hypothetical protein MIND_00167900 [Mycena indigotica]|uniref:Fungal-type protein kinase domain-containing protein n=1 Tax=Mycena indigotica TaxID=2126181 RepID=A0A8H6WIU3_9AGAR|nr:uncharacterized protein MIND_00167900 [Mycena indigotica]KAF7316488.1 hypothetical protein MIND_00167900 [Mycena indigotica]
MSCTALSACPPLVSLLPSPGRRVCCQCIPISSSMSTMSVSLQRRCFNFPIPQHPSRSSTMASSLAKAWELFHALAHRNFPNADARECEHKVERMGTTAIWETSPFMALGLLENTSVAHTAKHDLESFFWVLLWCVLRYTPHGALACDEVFGGDATKKSLILSTRTFPVHVPEGTQSALHVLGRLMKQMVKAQNPPPAETLDMPAEFHVVFPEFTPPGDLPKDMNYSRVQTLFAMTLARTDGWPENDDAAISFRDLEAQSRLR